MTGYWIVVASVVLAVVAVLVALLSDLPEWQLPLRRQTVAFLYRMGPSDSMGLDPSSTAWNVAVARSDPPLIEVREEQLRLGTSGASSRSHTIESIVSRRPALVVIVGAPALLLSGRPLAEVAAEIERIVSRLAPFGCSSIIQGCHLPTSREEWDRSAIDLRALSRLAASWNATLASATQHYGTRVVHHPDHLQEAIRAALSRPLALDLSSSDASDFHRSEMQRSNADRRGNALRRCR